MNNVPQGQNFRQRRNNNYKKGGGGRQDFRRGNSNSGHAFNNQGTRHPELDIVIDSRAAQRANTMRDKYQSMARDAQTGGDRVYAEFCLQHVEHYSRIINAYNESRPQPQARHHEATDANDINDTSDVNENEANEGQVTDAKADENTSFAQSEIQAEPVQKVTKVAIARPAKIATIQPAAALEETPSQAQIN